MHAIAVCCPLSLVTCDWVRRGALQRQYQDVLRARDQLRHDGERKDADLLRLRSECLGRVLQHDFQAVIGDEGRRFLYYENKLRLCLHPAALENLGQQRVTAWDAEKRALAEQIASLTRERDALQADAQSHLVRKLSLALGCCHLRSATSKCLKLPWPTSTVLARVQARNRALHQSKQAAEAALEAHRREHSEQLSRLQRAQQVCDLPALLAFRACAVRGCHELTIVVVLQGLDEEVRVLKGSLDAAENCKAAAEHELQTVKSNNTDLEVRRSRDALALKSLHSAFARMLTTCDCCAEPE